MTAPITRDRQHTLIESPERLVAEIKYSWGQYRIEVVSMGLSPNEHQGYFGESFVRVLASAAGLIVNKEDLDTRGVDFTIAHKGVLGGTRHPSIEVQVKSWSRRRAVLRNECWKYGLKAKHFNELAGTDFGVPRFLILVIVPDDWTDYAAARSDCTEMRYAAYWHSLHDHQRVSLAPNETIPVDIPHANRLTVETWPALIRPGVQTRMEA